MNKFFITLFLSISMFAFGQAEKNIFEGEETTSKKSNLSGVKAVDAADTKWEDDTKPQKRRGPGNPGEPGDAVPVDGAISLLLIVGSCIIVYYVRKQKSINI